MSADEIKALVMRFLDEPWNKGNVDVLDELCAPEYTLHVLPENMKVGRDDLKQAAHESREAADFCATLDELIVEGDRAAYQWTMSSTVDGKLKKTVGITILHFKDGKIVEDRFVSADVKVE
jgi:ketosteroid isomerase-like protein